MRLSPDGYHSNFGLAAKTFLSGYLHRPKISAQDIMNGFVQQLSQGERSGTSIQIAQ
jgi:hypothetical protein